MLSNQLGIPGMRSDGFITSGLSGDIVAFAAPSAARRRSNKTTRKSFMLFFLVDLEYFWNLEDWI